MPRFDKSWTLFLDRDGVINVKLPGAYVHNIESFVFAEGAREAIASFTRIFGRIIVITNQQGIGKGMMNTSQLMEIHWFMLQEIESAGGRIDAIYFCPDLDGSNSPDRKPATGMALKAKQDFPDIDFSKTIMAGDSYSDMEFGRKLGMTNIFISNNNDVNQDNIQFTDHVFNNLKSFSESIK